MQQSSTTLRNDSFLLRQFREFYTDVIRMKRMAESGVLKFQAMSMAQEPATVATVVNVVWQNLVNSIEQKQSAANRSVDTSASTHRELVYVMAALADEIFLNLEWEGREIWQSKLLESYFFGTHVAGEEFFQGIERTLQNRDTRSLELATVYLNALALGFQGKYRGTDGEQNLFDLRQKLYTFVFREDPKILEESNFLFQDTYGNTVTKGTGKRLASPGRWFTVAAVVVGLFLITSHIIWVNISNPLEKPIDTLLGRDKIVMPDSANTGNGGVR